MNHCQNNQVQGVKHVEKPFARRGSAALPIVAEQQGNSQKKPELEESAPRRRVAEQGIAPGQKTGRGRGSSREQKHLTLWIKPVCCEDHRKDHRKDRPVAKGSQQHQKHQAQPPERLIPHPVQNRKREKSEQECEQHVQANRGRQDIQVSRHKIVIGYLRNHREDSQPRRISGTAAGLVISLRDEKAHDWNCGSPDYVEKLAGRTIGSQKQPCKMVRQHGGGCNQLQGMRGKTTISVLFQSACLSLLLG